MIDRIRPFGVIVAVIALLVVGNAIALRSEGFTLEIMPSELIIGTSFAGKEVFISGTIPKSRDIIIEVEGPAKKAIFNLKGKVGPFWMNRAKVELENTPYYYMLLLPGNLDCDEICASLGLGIANLKKKISFHVSNMDPDVIFTNFLELKRSEHLYGELSDAIKYFTKEGEKHFETKVHFPSATAPGKYKITAIQLRNNHVIGRYVKEYIVKEGGIIDLVHRVAYEHELLYGIFCVTVAILFGILIGLFFKRAGAH